MPSDDPADVLLKQQKVLADFGSVALQSEDLDAVLTEACRLVGEALGTERAKVLEIEAGGQSLLVRAGVGWAPDVVGHVHLPMDEHSSETYAIKAGEPVITQDIRTETRFGLPDFLTDAGVVALVNVPIVLPGQRAYGLLQLDDTVPRDFDQHDIEFLRTYAIILGPVIDRLHKVAALRTSEERFRLTVETATDYAILTTDNEDRIIDWLPGAEAVFGWSAQEAIGQPAAILFTPEDREAGRPEWENETARREGHAPNVRWHLRKDGARVFIEGSVWRLHDAQGEPRGFLKIGQDVTERREADERLRTLMQNIPQLIWRARDTGDWIWASPQWLDFTGQSQEQSRGQGWLDVVHPDDRARARVAWFEAREHGGLDVEFRVRRAKDGAWLWHQTRAHPMLDSGNGHVEWLGTTNEVHVLKELQERQAVMVNELQHRTRNLIGVVSSIATQIMAHTGPTDAFREEFHQRLAALSRVQDLLSRAEQEPVTLRALLQLELDAMGATKGDGIRLDGPTVRIRPTIVQILALVLHELTTNARKYGALSDGGGRLGVEWQVRQDKGGRWLLIEWREEDLLPSAQGASTIRQGGGYGRRLIERALPFTLDAQTTYVVEPTEIRCTIDLPLDRPGQDGRHAG
ncbi:PAS domain S-box protein [Rubellimicrobium rubrum]|uniref:histidine kinase n=1 Tax=Rubellimicrobium rubrum TaxID=2585369 RepID=A0A5C4MTB3_9RHOB|nr:PAS domain S-box protein [Rubellimicrobium rubrum]TNC47698.1 PAS domain S-box protein [Rubellimicrobium rubrum]